MEIFSVAYGSPGKINWFKWEGLDFALKSKTENR